jgi:hypothetical protein
LLVERGLSKVVRVFGNGAADNHVFQIDRQFAAYRAAKLTARAERVGKYYATRDFSPDVARAVAGFIFRRLAAEHPDTFQRDDRALACTLTNELLHFDENLRLTTDKATVSPPYADPFDALACQVQEDLAVISASGNRHWLSAVHLCFPNHWAAEDKVGRTFAEIHEPVAGIEPVNRRAEVLVRTMKAATEGLVRFAWGVTADPRLNHHPHPPPGAAPRQTFDPGNPRAFVRVERQTMWGLPDVGASLFTIRTYLVDCAELTPAERADLAAAVESMTPESLAYKGLASWKDDLVRWLS